MRGAHESPVWGSTKRTIVALDSLAVGKMVGSAKLADLGSFIVWRTIESRLIERHYEAALRDIVFKQ